VGSWLRGGIAFRADFFFYGLRPPPPFQRHFSAGMVPLLQLIAQFSPSFSFWFFSRATQHPPPPVYRTSFPPFGFFLLRHVHLPPTPAWSVPSVRIYFPFRYLFFLTNAGPLLSQINLFFFTFCEPRFGAIMQVQSWGTITPSFPPPQSARAGSRSVPIFSSDGFSILLENFSPPGCVHRATALEICVIDPLAKVHFRVGADPHKPISLNNIHYLFFFFFFFFFGGLRGTTLP